MIRIYVPHLTERLRYIFHYVFTERWGIECCFVDEWEKFEKESSSFKLIYAPDYSGEMFYIQAVPLLFETDIKEQQLHFSWQDNVPLCFQTESEKTQLPFDVFAACFYFLSRYEEYLPFEPDEHGRYKAENSVAYKNNLLQIALVDRWIAYFGTILKQHFPDLELKQPTFQFIPTYDIDNAFLYKSKDACIALAGMAKQFFTGEWKSLQLRLQVISGKRKDPYDTFDYLEKLHRQYHLQAIFFILFAARSTYDKNNFINNKNFISLIQRLEANAKIGIHASYASSFTHKKRLQKEIYNLQNRIHQPIDSNRQHFLRLRLPESYDNLSANQIKNDYSMGYVSHIGFRAGTCFPFYFFDLQKNKTTTLQIHSFLFMENALCTFSDTSVSALWEQIKPCLEEVKKHKGELVTLFHNPSFGVESNIDFKSLYEKIIHYTLE